MSKERLIVLSSTYPYGKGESFISIELEALSEYFDVMIIPRIIKKGPVRDLPDGVVLSEKDLRRSLSARLISLLPVIFLCVTHLKILRHEIQFSKPHRTGKKKKYLYQIGWSFFKGVQDYYFLRGILHQNLDRKSSPILYSYWFSSSALALALFKDKYVKIARAHGGDLFYFRSDLNYLPFHSIKLEHIDSLLLISNQAKNYWQDTVSKDTSKLFVNKLVTLPGKFAAQESINKCLLVSCSNLIPLKRVHLIIDALSEIQTKTIQWVHFGDGPLREDLEGQAENKLGPKMNIQFSFKGHLPNAEVLDFYRKNNPAVFVHTSATEGLPVSMIEAASFGIPIIASDVGGVSEIVTDKNGLLLSANPSPSEIAMAIESILKLPASGYEELRKNALQLWEKNHSANQNHRQLIDHIKLLKTGRLQKEKLDNQ